MAKSNDPRKELVEILKQKQDTIALMGDVVRKMYEYEESYLKDTEGIGNIVRGWNNNPTSSNNVPNRNTQDRRHSIPINDADRIFSNSSVTSNAATNSIREAGGTLNSETVCSTNGNDFEEMSAFVKVIAASTKTPVKLSFERSSGRKKSKK